MDRTLEFTHWIKETDNVAELPHTSYERIGSKNGIYFEIKVTKTTDKTFGLIGITMRKYNEVTSQFEHPNEEEKEDTIEALIGEIETLKEKSGVDNVVY